MQKLTRAFFLLTALCVVLVGSSGSVNAELRNPVGANAWVFPHEDDRWSATFGDISTSLVFGDLNGDEKTEVIYGTSMGYVFAVKPGEHHYRHIRAGQSIKVTPILIDFERRGHPDIVVFAREADFDKPAKTSKLVIIDGITFTKKIDIELEGSIVSPPALADFNNDGKVDLLVPAGGLVLIDGSFEKNAAPHVFPTPGVSYASPVVEDLNDDGIYDFMYVYKEKNVSYLDIYLSTGESFGYSKLTFHLKNDVRSTPTLIKQKEGDTIVWRLIVPTTNKLIDFYSLSWNKKKSEMSLQHEKEISADFKPTAQLPAIWMKDKAPSVFLTGSDNKAATQINAVTGDTLSTVSIDKGTSNNAIYFSYAGDGNIQPFVLVYGDDALYALETNGKGKKKLTTLKTPMPALKEMYLVNLHGNPKRYSLIGLTEENLLYMDSTTTVDLPLVHPNVPAYFNQGIYPPQEMLSLIREMDSSVDWRNETGIRRITSYAAELYPADKDFQEAFRKYHEALIQEKRLSARVEKLKAEIRKKAKKYDYLTLIQWIMSENVEKEMDYIVKEDPEFLEERGMANLYTRIRIAREFIEAFFPLANWIVILSLFVLIVFNYPLFIKGYYGVFLRSRIKRRWKEVLTKEPTARQLVEEIGVDGLIKRRHSHMADLKIRLLMPLLINRRDNLWHDCLRLIEDEAIRKGHQRDRIFFRYLLYLYKKLFYIKIWRESFLKWLLFEFKHFFKRDFYDFPSSDPRLKAIKYELALKFLNLSDYKPGFNYINKQILINPGNPQLREFLSLIQEHKIENYFYAFGSHFFRRNKGLKSQIKILSYFKGLNLTHRVQLILNGIIRESLRRNGFPKVVVNDYMPLEEVEEHPLYTSISAYNYLRKARVVLRCIPLKYRSLDISRDVRINTLPNNFARVYNTHKNRRWIVQVEAVPSGTSADSANNKTLSPTNLQPENLKPKDIQNILLSVIDLVGSVSPLWFVPNLHPSFVHYDGTSIYLSGTGVSKLESDRLTIGGLGVFKRRTHTDLFTTPEFFANPNAEAVFADPDRVEKTASYLIGLLAFWMIEGHMPQSGRSRLTDRFKEADRFVESALAPYEVRGSLETLRQIALRLPVDMETDSE